MKNHQKSSLSLIRSMKSLVGWITVTILFVLSVGSSMAAGSYGQFAYCSDPSGDVAPVAPSPQYDAKSLMVTRNFDTLSIQIHTYTPLDSNSIGGYIDLDTDQNSATGASSHYNTYPQFGSSTLGMDYYVDLVTYNG